MLTHRKWENIHITLLFTGSVIIDPVYVVTLCIYKWYVFLGACGPHRDTVPPPPLQASESSGGDHFYIVHQNSCSTFDADNCKTSEKRDSRLKITLSHCDVDQFLWTASHRVRSETFFFESKDCFAHQHTLNPYSSGGRLLISLLDHISFPVWEGNSAFIVPAHNIWRLG